VAALAAALAPGSFVAISHLTADFAPEAVSSGVAADNTLVPAAITAPVTWGARQASRRAQDECPGW